MISKLHSKLVFGLATILFSSHLQASEGLENLLKRQNENGGFIAPIETSSILYNAQMVYLYSYLGLMDQKQDRVQGLIKEIQSEQAKGLAIYDGGEEQLPLVKTAMLAYHVAGLSSSESYKSAREKLAKHPEASDDFFTTPYAMIFGLNQTGRCVPSATWNFLIKRDKKIPWVKILAYPVLYLLVTDGTQEVSGWPLEIKASSCLKKTVAPEVLKKMSLEYFTWFKSYVESDGTMFDYSPTTIPNLMALHHAKKYLPELADEIQFHINRSLNTLEKFQVAKGEALKQAAGEASIAETVEMLHLMIESKMPAQDPRLISAVDFILKRQNKNGGWGFSAHNTHFPDPDDTGLVISMLHELQKYSPRSDVELSIHKALAWLSTRNNPDGGFAGWDLKQDMIPFIGLMTRPLAKRGLVLVDSVIEGTSRATIGLGLYKDSSPQIHRSWKRAISWLMKKQESNGSYLGTWMVGAQFGTASAITALSTAIGDKSINQKQLLKQINLGLKYVINLQQPDGAFGDHPRTYDVGKPQPLAKASPAFTGIIASRLMQFDYLTQRRWNKTIQPVLLKSSELLESTMNEQGLWDDSTWTAVTFPKIEYARYPFIQQLEGLRVLIYSKGL